MIEIEIESVETYGWEAAVRGMRNPMNSWEKSDSCWCLVDGQSEFKPSCDGCPYRGDNGFCSEYIRDVYVIGENDLALMKKLVNAGTDHSKFMRMITVTADVVAPLYWWKEFDTYKVGTVANSCSTMHTITKKEFTLDDFSTEHILNERTCIDCYVLDPFDLYNDPPADFAPVDVFDLVIDMLNKARSLYLKTGDKIYWWQIIQLLPESYNQRRTIQLNYAVLRNIYFARKDHKLDEWHDFCKWIKSLPYSELITGGDELCN